MNILFPLPKVSPLKQRKKEERPNSIASLLVKLQWKPKEKNTRFSKLTRQSETIQFLNEDQ